MSWKGSIVIILVVYTVSISSDPLGIKTLRHRHRHLDNSHDSNSGKIFLQRAPREVTDNFTLPSEDEIKSMCKEICSLLKNTGKSSKSKMAFKNYNEEQRGCICQNKSGVLVLKKLQKPKPQQPLSLSYTENGSRLVVVSASIFPCNASDPINKRCSDFCHQSKQTNLHSCSTDGSRCMCFNYKEKYTAGKSRPKRQMVMESIEGPGDDMSEIVGMHITPPHPIRRPPSRHTSGSGFHGHGHGNRPHHNYPSCTPHSCTNECPYHCDSLCRHNRECYCSCPDDVSYEYYDDSPFSRIASLFG